MTCTLIFDLSSIILLFEFYSSLISLHGRKRPAKTTTVGSSKSSEKAKSVSHEEPWFEEEGTKCRLIPRLERNLVLSEPTPKGFLVKSFPPPPSTNTSQEGGDVIPPTPIPLSSSPSKSSSGAPSGLCTPTTVVPTSSSSRKAPMKGTSNLTDPYWLKWSINSSMLGFYEALPNKELIKANEERTIGASIIYIFLIDPWLQFFSNTLFSCSS
ncbi:hypothetical protein NE237_015624 [Protea cynaroides]|uniref:Uncharacterized protein n=1 Tax=Protea cynaroides TaxID=273540 RepID=A0A9Q0QR90_9MAGN|nr:hypothetical protein NE237_015624 [Protea cynaroides]